MQFLLTDGLDELGIARSSEAVGRLGSGDVRILAFDSEDSALSLLRRCSVDPAALAALRRLQDDLGHHYALDRSADQQVLSTLARSIARGELVVIARKRVGLAPPIPTSSAQTPLAAEQARAKPQPPVSSPPAERPPAAQETIVLAPVAQAAALEAAAASGAPLCET